MSYQKTATLWHLSATTALGWMLNYRLKVKALWSYQHTFGLSGNFFYIYFSSCLNTLPLSQTLWSPPICTHKHGHVFLSVCYLCEISMGNFPRMDYSTALFNPQGRLAGPAAFSISDLGAGLLLPPAPHSLERNPCYRCVLVLAIERLHPCFPHFPAALLLVSLISPTSVA